LIEELDSKWILNLSVQFRDHSKNEKFFVTYAARPNSWRRLTVTWDYHNLREGSLEADLKSMTLQRDKNIRLYQSLRVSLPDIQFFDTVTNLTLRTEDDDHLHIYVAEDHNEIIHYPSIKRVAHIDCPRYTESKIVFEEHLSGFVYKARINNRVVVKKDIPGPNTIDEFLYEVNALHALQDSKAVIDLKGIVTDNEGKYIKAILISYGSRGTLCDMIFDHHHSDKLPWARRRKWARQILQGLCDIHEAGYVQGDFTISNMVVDEDDNASIIDLNRRGCPIGWEPPELMRVIQSRQRVSLMIGVKSDLYQLGMCLYALAEQVEEPERRYREDLLHMPDEEVPDWYKQMVLTCLAPQPQRRVPAVDLLRKF
ncbi:kinase-like protein, partial [Myriangium duriaei CBS 260.36]